MKIELSEKAQLSLDNIVKILDASHSLLHDIKKELVDANQISRETLDDFAKLKGVKEDDR